ncbi:hypothetical protein NV226_02100 [Mycoplasma iguanae]|uniref:ZIP Zinc transporter n=1 Tax=Mycoplasma iguanae TaxID=292461 RepID=A0ABY5RAY1_9MOLU|nr:hypothetical protein [Mycoplasma iguanae]UVD81507.1 hypothetical protein NV226_02100 [Mycoplasma iguanae]
MFPFQANDFGNENLAIFVNFLIYSAFLLVVPIVIIFLISFIKPRIKENSNIYLYAFSAAMLIIIGTLGFFKESYEKTEKFIHQNESLRNFAHKNTWNEQFLVMAIVAGGTIIGLTTIFIVRWIFVKFFGKEVHKKHDEHGHHDHMVNFSDIDSPKAAWLAILLLLSHRTIDGFVLGATISKLSRGENINLGLIITFNLHIIIEVLIVHYRQVQYGQTIKKSVIYNLLTILLLLPIMLVSSFLNKYIEQVGWLIPVINASGGAILTFVAIIELVPEFIHLRNGTQRKWYITLFWFASGIVFAVILLSFHSHDTVANANSDLLIITNSITELKTSRVGT